MVFYENKVTASTQNDTRWARITRGIAASTKLAAGRKGHTADHRRAQNSQRGRKHHFSHSAPLLGVFMRYSWDIRGVFVCIGYVSGMCRVCVGYLSEKYRKLEGRNKKTIVTIYYQQPKQHNPTTFALAQRHERRGGKSNDNSSTSHTSGTRRESALPRARLTAVDRGQLPE